MTTRWRPTRQQALLTDAVFEGDVEAARDLIEQGARHERLMGILLLGWCGGSKGWQSQEDVLERWNRLRDMLGVLLRAGYSEGAAPTSRAEQEVVELMDDVRRQQAAEALGDRLGRTLHSGASSTRSRL